jgi:hypothetical protein
MSERDQPRINYSHEVLERVLGGHVASIGVDNDNLRRAARAITDSVGPHSEKSAQVKLANAVMWISDAHREGIEIGRLEERRIWEQKIMKLFGVPR